MIRHATTDDATMRALERHETASHAIPRRELRDLGHAVVLFDPSDPDPFWNRMASVRWPADDNGFGQRMTAMLALFASLGRQPHIWPSPVHGTPGDLIDRLSASGFVNIGGGHVMVLDQPALCGPLAAGEAGRDVTVRGVRAPADAGPDDLDDMGLVLAESFGAAPGRAPALADDLRRTLGDPRIAVVLVRVGGEPAACAKATTFDGMTYLSSIGTREAFRGRGLAAIATRHAVAIGTGRSPGIVYLGVHSGNSAGASPVRAPGLRHLGRESGHAARMSFWARLTWQTAEPATLAADLALRFGVVAHPGGLVADAWLLDMGTAYLEVRPWVREGPADNPTTAGRLVLEPVPGGEELARVETPGAAERSAHGAAERSAHGAADRSADGAVPLVLVAIGWATVDTDRAEADLDMWLDPAPPGRPPDVVDPHLGARIRLRGAGSLPGAWIALVEPSTEGRAAASLARDGEGPCALYLAAPDGLDAWLAVATARGIALRGAPEPGPFGLQVALAGAPAAGPHVMVSAHQTPPSSGAQASTIGA